MVYSRSGTHNTDFHRKDRSNVRTGKGFGNPDPASAAGDIYSDQDKKIIATVAHQGALAAANVQLVEIQCGMSQQMVRGREVGHASRLCANLHDGVMQNLLFIKEIVRQNPEAAGHLGDVITTLRRIIKTQRPMNLALGLLLHLRIW